MFISDYFAVFLCSPCRQISHVSGINISGSGRKIVKPHGHKPQRLPLFERANVNVSQEESLIDQQLSDDFNDCPVAGEI